MPGMQLALRLRGFLSVDTYRMCLTSPWWYRWPTMRSFSGRTWASMRPTGSLTRMPRTSLHAVLTRRRRLSSPIWSTWGGERKQHVCTAHNVYSKFYIFMEDLLRQWVLLYIRSISWYYEYHTVHVSYDYNYVIAHTHTHTLIIHSHTHTHTHSLQLWTSLLPSGAADSEVCNNEPSQGDLWFQRQWQHWEDGLPCSSGGPSLQYNIPKDLWSQQRHSLSHPMCHWSGR